MKKWKVLLTDDDKIVHLYFEKVVTNLKFKNDEIILYHAFSFSDAIDILSKEKDIAILITDLVMEDENTGLKLINYVRNVLKNRNIRIALETARPEKANEEMVVYEYDVNAYIEKKI
ncbi:hypothetical protein JCM30566_10700 [Marinitoga arctica]